MHRGQLRARWSLRLDLSDVFLLVKSGRELLAGIPVNVMLCPTLYFKYASELPYLSPGTERVCWVVHLLSSERQSDTGAGLWLLVALSSDCRPSPSPPLERPSLPPAPCPWRPTLRWAPCDGNHPPIPRPVHMLPPA